MVTDGSVAVAGTIGGRRGTRTRRPARRRSAWSPTAARPARPMTGADATGAEAGTTGGRGRIGRAHRHHRRGRHRLARLDPHPLQSRATRSAAGMLSAPARRRRPPSPSPVSSPRRSASTIRVVVANRFLRILGRASWRPAASIHSGMPRRAAFGKRRRCLGDLPWSGRRTPGLPGERRPAGQHLVRDAAELVDIGPAIDAVAARLASGAMYFGSPNVHAQAGRRRLALDLDELGEAEVEAALMKLALPRRTAR